MSTILAAWATYAAAIGVIYTIGQKAADFLSPEALQAISRSSKGHPISGVFGSITLITTHVMDLALHFQESGPLFIPKLVRSALFSLVMVCLISYPLRGFAVINIVGLEVPFLPMVFEEPDLLWTWPISSFLTFIFVINNIVVDYISFIKTRTIISWIVRIRFPYREILLIPSDFLLSILISIFISALVTMLLLYWIMIFDVLAWDLRTTIILYVLVSAALMWQQKWRRLSTIARRLFVIIVVLTSIWPILGVILLFVIDFTAMRAILFLNIGAIIFALVTSLGIAFVSVFVTAIELMRWCIWRLEGWQIGGKNIWQILNFENKPTLAAAVMVIAVFTMFYWPLVVLLAIERSVVG
jgi:hypothetical protein